MGTFITWVVVGGLAGWLASKIMKTDKSMGIFANVIVGIIGAFVGGFIFSLFDKQGFNGFNFYSFLVALIGAVILLAVVKAIRK